VTTTSDDDLPILLEKIEKLHNLGNNTEGNTIPKANRDRDVKRTKRLSINDLEDIIREREEDDMTRYKSLQ
jgi:hypothetical protein